MTSVLTVVYKETSLSRDVFLCPSYLKSPDRSRMKSKFFVKLPQPIPVSIQIYYIYQPLYNDLVNFKVFFYLTSRILNA